MLLRYAIGSALRRIRLDRELTLRTVADTARISMPYLSEIERGRKEPSSEILEVICRALGLTLVDLLAEATDEALVAVPSSTVSTSAVSTNADQPVLMAA